MGTPEQGDKELRLGPVSTTGEQGPCNGLYGPAWWGGWGGSGTQGQRDAEPWFTSCCLGTPLDVGELHPLASAAPAWVDSVSPGLPLSRGISSYFQWPLPTAGNQIRGHLIPHRSPMVTPGSVCTVDCRAVYLRGQPVPSNAQEAKQGCCHGGAGPAGLPPPVMPTALGGREGGRWQGSGLSSADSLIHLHNGSRQRRLCYRPAPGAPGTDPAAGSNISASARCSPPRPFSPGHKEGAAGCPA